jgi:hypothetical protein
MTHDVELLYSSDLDIDSQVIMTSFRLQESARVMDAFLCSRLAPS